MNNMETITRVKRKYGRTEYMFDLTTDTNNDLYKSQFSEWARDSGLPLKDETYKFKAGDIVEFRGGFNLLMKGEILGFHSKTGEAYFLQKHFKLPVHPIRGRFKKVEVI